MERQQITNLFHAGSSPVRRSNQTMPPHFVSGIFIYYLRIHMPRPNFITEEDITRWSKELEQSQIPKEMIKSAVIREVCYSGIWLAEQLAKLECPDSLTARIQFSAGKASFGKDTWEIHQKFLDDYKNNELNFEPEPENLN